MANFTTFLLNKLIDHGATGKTAYTKPTISAGLQTVIPTDAGTGGTEVTGGSYARVTPAGSDWSASSGKAAENANAITFAAATADWGEIQAVTLHDASSAGNILVVAPLVIAASRVAGTGKASDDLIYSTAHGLVNTDKVLVEQILGLALPAGLSEGTPYFVVSASTDTFSLALTSGGSAINITASGALQVVKTNFRTVQNGDTFKVNAGDLDLAIDA